MSESLNTYNNDSIEALLELVEGGLQHLFVQCKAHNVAPPLYGRNIYTPPDSQSDEGDPEFRFDYGFSPLGVLADYLHKHDPKTIAAVKARREEVHTRLQQQGEHAKHRNEVQRMLQESLATRRCGVLGPLVSYASNGDVVVWCRTLRPGTVVVQVSQSESFDELSFSNESVVEEPYGQSVLFTVNALSPGSSYVARVFIRENDLSAESTEAITAFTVPTHSDVDSASKPSMRVFASSSIIGSSHSSTPSTQPASLVCLLGDPYTGASALQTHIRNAAFRRNGMLRQSAVCVAWSDESIGADTDFKAEEVIFKQYSRDLHRFERKKAKHAAKVASESLQAPVLQFPPLSAALQQALDFLPLAPLSNDKLRTTHHHLRFGDSVDMFLLDSRAGYIGREQLKWLYSGLRRSNAVWKFVACSHSVLLEATEPSEEQPDTARSARTREGEEEEQGDKNAQASEKKIDSLSSLIEHLQNHYADRYSVDPSAPGPQLPTGIVFLTSAPRQWCVATCDPLELGWAVCMEICVDGRATPRQEDGASAPLIPRFGATMLGEGVTRPDHSCYANISFATDDSFSVEIVVPAHTQSDEDQKVFSCIVPYPSR